jgi:Polyketide cyclase / dehydrase and lipid transport
MAPLVSTVEVARPQDEVHAYVTDPSRFVEWQKNVVGGHMEGDGAPCVGSRCITRRRIGFAERPATSEITSVNPPETWSLRGIDGPIRAVVNVTVEGLEATRSRVTIDLDFEGHGIGKLLVPLVVRRDAQKEMPENLGRLKDRLESRA